MATITRGTHDQIVTRIKAVLDEYERERAGSIAALYRHDPASVRIRIVDERFNGQSKGDRHDDVWKFLADRLSDEDIEDVSMLLLLAPGEQGRSMVNWEFDEPIPSVL